MGVVTIKPVVPAGIPQPRYRFSDDTSVVMSNRSTSFGSSGTVVSGGAPPAGVTQFNIGSGETASTIEARTGDPAGFITWAIDTFDVYVSDGNDNWAVFKDVAF